MRVSDTEQAVLAAAPTPDEETPRATSVRTGSSTMLDANEAAFLRSVAEEGDDNTGRLALADWLEDRGDAPRAEFIRVQCELASAGPTEERRRALRLRERDLLNAHRRQWCEALDLPVEDVHFARGLIARVRLSQWEGGRVLDPAHAPRFATLEELDLSGLQLGDDGLAAFAHHIRLPALRKLILSENGITDAGASALSRATGLPHLNVLYLFDNPIRAAGMIAVDMDARFRLRNLDVGDRDEGYCMSPGQSEVARRQYVRTKLLPAVATLFNTHERLQSAVLCVAQYWDDEADDAVHGRLVVSELLEPTLEGTEPSGETSGADPNLPTTRIKLRDSETSSSEIWLWDLQVDWPDNRGAIPLWAAFAPEGGTQNYNELKDCYAPAVMFYRHGGYEILPMCRPHLDGVRPEWGWEG
jgi:uncharacterized protein (TIGR02996 family)